MTSSDFFFCLGRRECESICSNEKQNPENDGTAPGFKDKDKLLKKGNRE